MKEREERLRLRLKRAGYSDTAISAVWPAWWSDDAAKSRSARAELRFSIAKKLGLDPRFLLENDEPRFVWIGESKYKHLRDETDWERLALSSYGIAVGKVLTRGARQEFSLEGMSAQRLRSLVLQRESFVGLHNLLAISWSAGIPIVHLKILPLTRKRMCAMCVKTKTGYAILVGRDAKHPAKIAFYVAHEIGHILLGHLKTNAAIVDLGDPISMAKSSDEEELEADRFALELLTGMPSPKVYSTTDKFTATQLAQNALKTGHQLNIEPGTLALCLGFTTGRWRTTNAALNMIYEKPYPVWKTINHFATTQINWDEIPSQMISFVRAITGMKPGGQRESSG